MRLCNPTFGQGGSYHLAGQMTAPGHLLPSLQDFCRTGPGRESLLHAQLTILLLSKNSDDNASLLAEQATSLLTPLEEQHGQEQSVFSPNKNSDNAMTRSSKDSGDSRLAIHCLEEAHEPGLEVMAQWEGLHGAYRQSRDDASKERILSSMGHFIAGASQRDGLDQIIGSVLSAFASVLRHACHPSEAASVRLGGQKALQISGKNQAWQLGFNVMYC